MQNIRYIDLTSGIVKTSHHADFDEAWYLQPSRPPAAQLLYDIGLKPDDRSDDATNVLPPLETTTPITPSNLLTLSYVVWHPPMIWRHQPISLVTTNVPWPPMKSFEKPSSWIIPPESRVSPLSLRETALPTRSDQPYRPHTASAAMLHQTPTFLPAPPSNDSLATASLRPVAMRTKANLASELVSEYMILRKDITPLYMSPCPYFDAFEEEIDLRKFDITKHRTAGLCLAQVDGRLILSGMAPSTAGAKITRW